MGNWPHEPSVWLCVDVCESKCCRTPQLYLTLTPEEEKLFEGHPLRNEITVKESDEITKTIEGRFLWFRETNGKCPHLDVDGYCEIYEDRPEACRTFPVQATPGCLVWPIPWPAALTPLRDVDLPIARLNR